MKIFLILVFSVALQSAHSTANAQAKSTDKENVAKKPSSKKTAKNAAAKKRVVANDVDENDAVKVLALDPYFPVEDLGQGYQAAKPQSSSILAPADREHYFKQSGITKYVETWDHFDRDMLVLRLKNEPIEVVAQKYPTIPTQLLQKLNAVLPK